MKVYAERPVRALGQFVADLLLVAWVGGWVWLGLQFHDRLDALRGPTRQVGEASSDLANSLSNTGEQLRGLQLVGELLAAPFDAIVGSARQLVDASENSDRAIAQLADLSMVVTAFFPIVFALTVWVVLRGRWMRRATAAARLRASGYGDGLLAAQALGTARLDQLAPLANPGNPLDDPISRRRLASYQLRRLGLRSYDPG
ncbi:MAG TPA: hypothetical protein VK891_14540 [Euzebyales bacterium]|nr:hypothetical protein [Euzebyales bacterium]